MSKRSSKVRPLGEGRKPGSWRGTPVTAGVGFGASLNSSARHSVGSFNELSTEAPAMVGIDTSAGAAKLKAEVRSPTFSRRQAVKFGTLTPNRVSRKRSSEV